MERSSNQVLVTNQQFFNVLNLTKYFRRRCPKGSVVYLDPRTLAIYYRKEL